MHLISYTANIEKTIAKITETSPIFAKVHSCHKNNLFCTAVNMNNLICQKAVYIPDISISAHINPLVCNAPFFYPLKTSENLRFSDVFRE